jgi:hypothetical protein
MDMSRVDPGKAYGFALHVQEDSRFEEDASYPGSGVSGLHFVTNLGIY